MRNMTDIAVRDLRVRRAACEQLDDRAPERPYIRLGRRAVELNHLWRHPVRRARDLFILPPPFFTTPHPH